MIYNDSLHNEISTNIIKKHRYIKQFHTFGIMTIPHAYKTHLNYDKIWCILNTSAFNDFTLKWHTTINQDLIKLNQKRHLNSFQHKFICISKLPIDKVIIKLIFVESLSGCKSLTDAQIGMKLNHCKIITWSVYKIVCCELLLSPHHCSALCGLNFSFSSWSSGWGKDKQMLP